MSALPKRRLSTRRKGKRKAGNFRSKLPALSLCKHCHQTKINHTLCPNCKRY